MSMNYGSRRDRPRVRLLNEETESEKYKRLGWDPRKTYEENMGYEGVFDRPDDELDWPDVAPQRHKPTHEARELAAEGRGNDTEIAHVARGEFVIPPAFLTPELLTALSHIAAAHGVPLERLIVGNARNRINPNTGAPEFDPTEDDIELEPLSPVETPAALQNQGLPPDIAQGVRRSANLISASVNPSVQAALSVIKQAEGGAPNLRYGGSTFTDFSKHPGALPRPLDPQGNPIGPKQSAAGSWQMLEGTFNEKQKQYGLPDFAEPNQQLAAIAKLKERNVLDMIRAGNFGGALDYRDYKNHGLQDEWAALPGDRPTAMSREKAEQLFNQYLNGRTGR